MAVLSRVEVIGGSYKGRQATIIGETPEFWRLKLDIDSTGARKVCRTKKNNVRPSGSTAESEPGAAEAAESPVVLVAEPEAAKEQEQMPDGAEDDSQDTEEEDEESSQQDGEGQCEAVAATPRPASGVIGSHTLTIMTWNACKMSFLGKNEEGMRDYLDSLVAEVARLQVEVLVLQEVPLRVGGARLQELRKRLNRALLEAGVPEDRHFGEATVSEVEAGREVHAVLLRPPVRLEQALTLGQVGSVPFKYPPLLVSLRDDRFSFPALRRLVVTSAHTPGSKSKECLTQRILEVKALLNSLHDDAVKRLGGAEELRFCDVRTRRKAAPVGPCAAPWILCGDLNVDLFKHERGIPQDQRGKLWDGLTINAHPQLCLVEVKANPGGWVGGAPAGGLTSSGGRCFDWFLWNADVRRRLCPAVKPVHLSAEAVRRQRQVGLSDHDCLLLELTEDGLHRHRRREDYRKQVAVVA